MSRLGWSSCAGQRMKRTVCLCVLALITLLIVGTAEPAQAQRQVDYCKTPLSMTALHRSIAVHEAYVSAVQIGAFVLTRRFLSLMAGGAGSSGESISAMNGAAWIASFVATRRLLRSEFRQINCLRRQLDRLLRGRRWQDAESLSTVQRRRITRLRQSVAQRYLAWLTFMARVNRVRWMGDPSTESIVVYDHPRDLAGARRAFLRAKRVQPRNRGRIRTIIWRRQRDVVADKSQVLRNGKDKTGPLAKRSSDWLRDGAEARPRLGLTFSIDPKRVFSPKIDFNLRADGKPLHSFENDYWSVNPKLGLWWQFPTFKLHGEVFGSFWRGKDSQGATSGPSAVGLIDGSNTAAITATRNNRLEWHGHRLGGRLYGSWERRLQAGRVLLGLMAGAMLSHAYRNYDYSSEVSGGGPFFTNNIKLDMYTLFAAPLLGAYATIRFTPKWSLRVSGTAAPGWKRYRLDGRQTGTALPPGASISATTSGFAFRGEVGTALNYDPLRNLRITIGVKAGIDTASPVLERFPVSGQSLRPAFGTRYHLLFLIKARLTIF